MLFCFRCPLLTRPSPYWCLFSRPGIGCESDSDCDAYEKCCPGTCGGSGCAAPDDYPPIG